MKPNRMTYGQHPLEFADFYDGGKSANASTLVFFYHRGLWQKKQTLTLMEPLVNDLVALEYSVLNVEYPSVGTGKKCEEMIMSVFTSFKYFTSIIPHDHTIVIGHSAGGYYALMLGLQHRMPKDFYIEDSVLPDMIIAQAPIIDFTLGMIESLPNKNNPMDNFIRSEKKDVRLDEYRIHSPQGYMMDEDPIVHIIHGIRDEDVPLYCSEEYIQNCSYKNVFLTKGHFDHYEVLDPKHRIWAIQKKIISKI